MAKGTRKTTAASRLEKAAGGRRAAARAMTGLPAKGALPKKGTEARRAYDSSMRALQRASVAGKVNPKTGKAYQARPGRQRIERTAEEIKRRKELRRRKSVTLTLTAQVQINRDPRYTRRRTFPGITVSGAGYRALAERNEAALERMAAYLGEESGLSTAPGIADLDISGIEIADAQVGDADELGDE